MSWSATQYTKFEAERNRPAMDLLAQIPLTAVRTAVDLGCGPGNSTELLQRRFPDATITGIDSAPDMIAAAGKRLPHTAFALADIMTWADPGADAGSFDLLFANASLQWVPDHAALFPRLLAKLAQGGVLAVQIPDNLDEPAHRLMRQVAAEGPWASKLAEAAQARAARHDAAWYYRLIRRRATGLDIWRTTYHHPLAGVPAMVEWFKGTGLRPFLDPLEEPERAAFLGRYQAALARAYLPFEDGTVLLPFPRLFILATA